jgi:hypothetical protein
MKPSATYLLNDVARKPATRYFRPTAKNARVAGVSQKPPPRKHTFATVERCPGRPSGPSGHGMSPPTPRVTTLLLIARESVVTWSATSSSSSASSRISSLKTEQNSRPLSCRCDVHTCAPKRFRCLCSGLWGHVLQWLSHLLRHVGDPHVERPFVLQLRAGRGLTELMGPRWQRAATPTVMCYGEGNSRLG